MINAHATSTQVGDRAEFNALRHLLGNKKVWNNLEELKNKDA